MPWSAGEGNDIADVGHAGHKHQQALEAEAEARVRHAAIFAEIGIPRVGLGIDAVAREIFRQNIEPFFALTAADDLADAGHQQIHRGNGFAIVVDAHVEGFDFLRVVENGDRLFEVVFRKPALVFGLEVEAVLDRVLKGLAALLQQRDGIGVGNALEGSRGDELESFTQTLIDELFENRQIALVVFEHFTDEKFHQGLGEIHVAGEVAEGHLGFDHPELRRMARGVGVFRAKGRTKGIDVRQGASKGLALELAAHSEKRALAKEVLRVARDFFIGQRGDAKHFARPFAIAGGDDRRVNMHEVALLKKAMNRKGHATARAKHRTMEVRARTQVRDRTQKLRAVAFFLQRIILRYAADEADR